MLKLQELRIQAGLTQRELAEKIGVKNYTVANWEQNRTECRCNYRADYNCKSI